MEVMKNSTKLTSLIREYKKTSETQSIQLEILNKEEINSENGFVELAKLIREIIIPALGKLKNDIAVFSATQKKNLKPFEEVCTFR
jgi:hypothetical protein